MSKHTERTIMSKPKRLQDLGISQSNWDNRLGNEICDKTDADGISLLVCRVNSQNNNMEENVRLIKKAPNLYKCLYEAVMMMCKYCEDNHDWACTGKQKCVAKSWRKTLAEVAGEE